MNLFNIIRDIEQVDPEVYERLNSRRSAFGMLGKAALAAAPLALGSVFQKAYGKTNDAVSDVLNFALLLEYLESEFYQLGLAAAGLIPAANRAGFAQISKHEAQHVAFLKEALGMAAIAKPEFDFTAKGNFNDVFTNYGTFAAVAQVLEDTGVRAYKGQAGSLLGTDVLTLALQIHSVEARHASFVRRIRGQKGWIVGNDGGAVPAVAAANYAGEDNTAQGGLDKAMFAAAYSDATVSEAFDEILTREQVIAIATPFLA
ncbi:MAG: ferritin-like domain-containing protein [Ferruginibacter sp.]|nr:ferritin-like domain-containing protein [Cytophagales bacterium]